MFDGHDPYLVALSVVIAALGGYTGFGLAARIRGTPEASRRLLLASAAGFLAVGIWTMHFIGMMAAPIPADTVYLVLPTIISFLICALVVGDGNFRSQVEAVQRRGVRVTIVSTISTAARSAASQNRDRYGCRALLRPRLCSAPRREGRRHSASKTRVNALMALRPGHASPA